MRFAAVVAVLTVSILAGAACSDEGEPPAPTVVLVPETYRWLRSELTVPANAVPRVVVHRVPPESPGDIAEISIALVDDESSELRLDASTGSVITDTLSEADVELATAVLESVRVLDALPSVWPYVDEAAPRQPTRVGAVSYPTLSPSAGLVVFVRDDGLLVVHSGSTFMTLDAETGEIVQLPTLVQGQLSPGLQNEAPAFVRFFQESAHIIDVPASAD